ncbi:hypothetical protein [Streptomyces sp. NPDC046925]|uniref:hypothetical protein n=1 Tax=Streptomyces sp. NPDC046925 TaxID=3155375 RepID=UPI0033F8667B
MVRMVTSTQRRRVGAVSALLVGAALITACGEKPHGTAAAPAPSQSSSPAPSPYVEPGVVDGAPHNGDNNAYRRPGDMTPGSEEAAEAEAARMRPVLKRLHAKKKWDPESVRAALTGELGYEIVRTGSKGKVLSGSLTVQEMRSRYENDEYITPEGTMIGLRVRKDACVTAFVQPTNYEARANGPFMETGCMEPPVGH